jgi:TolB protein
MRSVRLAACAVLAAGQVCWGQETIRVVKSFAAKVALDLSPLKTGPTSAGALFRRTLEADLARSGWFTIAPPGAGAYAVSGVVQDSGGRLRVPCQVFNALNQQVKLNTSFSDASSEARRLAHQAADEIVLALTGFPGIASSRIVFIGVSGRNKELYLCDADGENLRQLTRDNSICLAPCWSPVGDLIAYTSYCRNGFPDVYTIHMKTLSRCPVASYPGINLAGDISPDGQDLALVLSKDGNPDLYILNLPGGRLTRLTRTPESAEASPTWSPDGNQIAFVSDSSGRPQIYMISRSGGEKRRLSSSRGIENVAPDWGPKGWVAYSSKRDGKFQVCVVNPQTQEDVQVTREYADWEDPSWAPDGRHIVCARTVQYSSSVYILDTLGDDPLLLVQVKGDWRSPAWSPR